MKDGKKYHGFLVLPRHAKMLQADLGLHLFGIYIALIFLARWHRSNPQMGHVIGTQTEIAKELHISQSSLSRSIEKLEAKRYVIRHTRYIILKYFTLFLSDVASKIHSKNYANLNELYADVYGINAELQQKYAISQENYDQNHPQRLYISSKDDSGSLEDFEQYFKDNPIVEQAIEEEGS